jgi:ribosome-binding factor A
MIHSFSRASRLEGLLHQEVGFMLLREIKDPRVSGIVTVVKTEVSRDLRHATFFISVLGGARKGRDAMTGIKRAQGFIRSMLGRRLDIKRVPEIHFKLDKSLDASKRIEELLSKIDDKAS